MCTCVLVVESHDEVDGKDTCRLTYAADGRIEKLAWYLSRSVELELPTRRTARTAVANSRDIAAQSHILESLGLADPCEAVTS